MATQNVPRRTDSNEEKFTIAQAFDWHMTRNGRQSDPERAVRSIALLLSELSDGGNEDVNGRTAHGLGLALAKYADDLADWQRWSGQDIRERESARARLAPAVARLRTESGIIRDRGGAPQPQSLPQLLFSLKEAAQMLSVSAPTLRSLVDNRKLRAMRVGRRVLIPRPEIERI